MPMDYLEGLDLDRLRGFQPPQAPDQQEQGDVVRGAKVALGQTMPILKGMVGLVGATAENQFGEGGVSTAIKNWGLKGYQEGMDKLAPMQKDTDELTDAWAKAKEGDVGALIDWAQYGLGYAIGQMGETAAMALVGGAAGAAAAPVAAPVGGAAGAVAGIVGKGGVKTLATSLIEKAVVKEANVLMASAAKTGAELAADQAVKQATKSVARNIAATGTLVGYGMVQELGSIYPEAENQATLEGRKLDGIDLARTWGAGLAAGGLEGLTDKLGLDAIAGKMKLPGSGIGARATRMGVGAAAGIFGEGATEAAQTALERYGAGQDLLSPEAIDDYINSAGLGAVGGAAVGAAANFKQVKEQQYRDAMGRLATAKTPDEIMQAAEDAQKAMPSVEEQARSMAQRAAQIRAAKLADASAAAHAYMNTAPMGGPARLYPMLPGPDSGPAAQMIGPDGQPVDAPAPAGMSSWPEAWLVGKDGQASPTWNRYDPDQAAPLIEQAARQNEQDNIAKWSSRSPAMPLEDALRILHASEDKGLAWSIMPHAAGEGFTVVPQTWLRPSTVAASQERVNQILANADQPLIRQRTIQQAAPQESKELAPDDLVKAEVARRRMDGTMAGRAFAAQFDAGHITSEDVLATMKNPQYPTAAEVGADEKIASAASQAPAYGDPVSDRLAALVRQSVADRESTGGIITTDGGIYGNQEGRQGQGRRQEGLLNEPSEGDSGVADRSSQPSPLASAIDEAAHQAATSPNNDLEEPSDAKKKAGNYKKGHTTWNGLRFTIENPEGSERSGTDPSGERWSVTMPAHYGYIKRTEGADGEQVDLYMGPKPESNQVFVVDQVDLATGKFDEHKAIAGVESQAEAEALYAAGFSDGKGPQRLGAITPMSVEQFRAWVQDGVKNQPVGSIDAPKATEVDRDKIVSPSSPSGDSEPPAPPAPPAEPEGGVPAPAPEPGPKTPPDAGQAEPEAPQTEKTSKGPKSPLFDAPEGAVATDKHGQQFVKVSEKHWRLVADEAAKPIHTISLMLKGGRLGETRDEPTPPLPPEKLIGNQRQRELDALKILSSDGNLGRSIEDLTDVAMGLLQDREAAGRLAKAAHEALEKNRARIERDKNRAPEVRADALASAVTSAYPDASSLTVEQHAAFAEGFDIALAGRRKSNVVGENLAYKQAGFEAGREWAKTPAGKAWVEGVPLNKLENTGVDLKRHMDMLRAAMKEKMAPKLAAEKILAATTRADIFRPALETPGMTNGAKGLVMELRGSTLTFQEWLDERNDFMGGGYDGSKNHVEKYLVGDTYLRGSDEYNFENRIQFLTAQAEQYISEVASFIRPFSGMKTVSEISSAIEAAYFEPASALSFKSQWEVRYRRTNDAGALAVKILQRHLRREFGGYTPQGNNIDPFKKDELTYELPVRTKNVVHPKLDRIERDGGQTREEGRDVTPSEMKEKFGFADIGFGNWVAKGKDQEHLNYAFDAFSDIASHLGVAAGKMGFGGSLHLTIGALGRGGKAAATFSPSHPGPNGPVQAINLTNTQGDGTVSHEWLHAMDHYATWNGSRGLIATLLNYGIPTTEHVKKVARRFLLDGTYWKGNKKQDKVSSAMYAMTREDVLFKNQSQFKVNADTLGKDYWGNDKEMLARATEAWFYDTLGYKSTYLVNPWVADGAVSPASGYRAMPYPAGANRVETNAIVGAMFRAMDWSTGRPVFSKKRFLSELGPLADGLNLIETLKVDRAAMEAVRDEAMNERQRVADEAEAARQAAEDAEKERKRQENELALQKLRQETQQEPAPEPVITPVPTPPMTPASKLPGVLSRQELEDLFDEAMAEMNEAAQEPEPDQAPSAIAEPVTPELPYTADDLRAILAATKEEIAVGGEAVPGMPTIQQVGAMGSTDHMGYGTFRTTGLDEAGNRWEMNWDAGGAMRSTGKIRWTIVSRSENAPAIGGRAALEKELAAIEARKSAKKGLVDVVSASPEVIADLGESNVELEVEIGDTGQKATLEVKASDAVSDIQKRLADVAALIDCLK